MFNLKRSIAGVFAVHSQGMEQKKHGIRWFLSFVVCLNISLSFIQLLFVQRAKKLIKQMVNDRIEYHNF